MIAGTSSRAGLERTVRLFDGWNPAGLAMARVLDVWGEMDRQRPPERSPLTVWPRLFVQPPGGTPDLGRLFDEVGTARAAGVTEVILDAGFWSAITEPADWLRAIEQLTPTLATT